jgi:hypothetical protein
MALDRALYFGIYWLHQFTRHKSPRSGRSYGLSRVPNNRSCIIVKDRLRSVSCVNLSRQNYSKYWKILVRYQFRQIVSKVCYTIILSFSGKTSACKVSQKLILRSRLALSPIT